MVNLVSWVKNTLGNTVHKEIPVSNDGKNMLTRIFGQNPPLRGAPELLINYTNSPWLRAVVHKVSVAVGDTEWKLYKSTKTSDKKVFTPLQRAAYPNQEYKVKFKVEEGKVTEIGDHPLLDLLFEGNSVMDGSTVFQLTNIYLDLIGEAFLMVERNRLGVPIGLWPVSPTWVKRFPYKDSPFYEVQAPDNKVFYVPVTEMISMLDPAPHDPYGRGKGTGMSLGDEIEIDEYSAKHAKTFFYNRARPDMIISGDSIQRADAARLEHQWLQKHQGFWNAWKPMFLSRKVDIKEITQSFEHLQLVPLRKHERDTIISVFGVPPEKLSQIGESKRSTISAADMFWTKDVVSPRSDRIRRAIQRQLVPMFDERIILGFESKITEDKELQLSIMKTNGAAFTIDEWRMFAGFAPLEDKGKAVILDSNKRVVELDKLTDPTPDAGNQLPPPADEDEDENEDETGDEEGENEEGVDNGDKSVDTALLDRIAAKSGVIAAQALKRLSFGVSNEGRDT